MTAAPLGKTGEDLAAAFLARAGWTILERNPRWRDGEIDIVAARAGLIAFVEVKTRRSRAFGIPAEAVTPAKQRRIRVLAGRWLAERRPRRMDAVRFDVVEVTRSGEAYRISHLEDAF